MSIKHETPELLAELRERLDYNPDTGVFAWKEAKPEHFSDGKRSASSKCKIWNGKLSGKKAGTMSLEGYLTIMFKGIIVSCHRLAYAFSNGFWPLNQIDHDNGIRNDNSFINLFDRTNAENGKNQKLSVRNYSGHIGVSLQPSGKFLSVINNKGKKIGLGRHDTFEQAVADRKAAEVKYGFHNNHGRKTPN